MLQSTIGRSTRQATFYLVIAALALITVLAWIMQTWLLTAVVIGFLFGFAMQRANFCGASIISSVVLLKDVRGVKGAVVAILVAMLGFAALSALGWVVPNPKPMKLLAAVVGGLVFGSGMVLAGGCVSGSLFKAGEGRLGSMLALIGIGVGTNFVGAGLFASANKAITAATQGMKLPLSIGQVVGLPYKVMAAALGFSGLIALCAYTKKTRRGRSPRPFLGRLITGGWSFTAAGLFIGVLGWFAYLSSSACSRNYPLGVTHGVMALFSMLVGGKVVVKWWLAYEAMAIVLGSATSAWLRRDLALRSADPATLLVSFFGGVLTGAGAVIGGGCFVGHILSGWALLSLHSILFGTFTIVANWATTILYLRGLR